MRSLGIVIIGRNEGLRLESCLKSLLAANAEVVYVDSASSDNSVEIAKGYNVHVVELTNKQKLNASVARNAGYAQLKKLQPNIEYVQFIDADCELNKDWLKTALSFMTSNPDYVACAGRLREKFITKNVFHKIADMSWYIKPGLTKGCGGIFMIKAATYEAYNGFNEILIAGADPEFFRRLSNDDLKIWILDSDMGTHDCAMNSWKMWFTRTVKTGFGFANGKIWGAWQDRVRSILIWSLLIPISILTLSTIDLLFLISFVLYPLQCVRIAVRMQTPYSFNERLLMAAFMIMSKFPQCIGIYRYYKNAIFGKKSQLIEYKK